MLITEEEPGCCPVILLYLIGRGTKLIRQGNSDLSLLIGLPRYQTSGFSRTCPTIYTFVLRPSGFLNLKAFERLGLKRPRKYGSRKTSLWETKVIKIRKFACSTIVTFLYDR